MLTEPVTIRQQRQEAGVWDQLHQLPLNKLRSKNQLDWERAVIDSSHVRAARRVRKRARPGRARVRAASTTFVDG
ncbi:hypothetical protein [Streptomyces flaveolus]|uniref:hypothetical protein n=1 Tax=Streptomyces flaveolus TaxID=67297 RepID=UPI00340B75FE